MQVTLTTQAEEMLLDALRRNPDRSPAEILERALAEHVRREAVMLADTRHTRQEFHAWLAQFTAYSDKIPTLDGETFSREVIYQDHS